MKELSRTAQARALWLVVIGAGLLVTACDRDNQALGTIPPREANRALLSVAAERCDRAERCMQVGPDHRYDTRGDCIMAVRARENDELNLRSCPGGIDERELNACLSAIKNSECEASFDAPTAHNACRESALCLGR